MTSSYEYRPLVGDEIRVLKIKAVDHTKDATNAAERRPIVCSIEHVCLSHASNDNFDQQSKGIGKTWPELSAAHDTKALFKDAKKWNAQESFLDKGTGNGRQTALAGESHLPWRHKWGDFIALSYAWKHPTKSDGESGHTVIVDGSPLEVAPNLYYALAQLQKSCRIRQGFRLWVDAICINQENKEEQGQQVARMQDIYQLAWQVVIWLGPEEQHSSLAISALHWLARESERSGSMDDFYHERFSIDMRPLFVSWPRYDSPMKKRVYEALFYFFARTYWRRMWVVQEVAMGNPQTPVMCGDKCIAWNDVYKAVKIIATDESRFGRAIIESVRPEKLSSWSFELGRDRTIRETAWTPERMWKIQLTMMRIQKDQNTDSDLDSWRGLVRALNLARSSLVTNEIDKVYGILGIKAIADRVRIHPDYDLTPSEIYSKFMSELISKGRLNVLRLVSSRGGFVTTNWKFDDLPSFLQNQSVAASLIPILDNVAPIRKKTPIGADCDHGLPTWTVCWTCAPAPTAQLDGAYIADLHMGHPLPVTPTGGSTITVKGVVLDTINSLSASNANETDSRYPLNSQDAVLSSNSIYGNLEQTRHAFWRTIVGDTTSSGGEKAPDEYSWLLNPKLWQRGVAGVWTGDLGLNDFMARNQQLRICGYSLRELIFGPSTFSPRFRRLAGDTYYNPTDTQREAFSWAINAMAWRRVFSTRGGRMGMGSCAAEMNDQIVILRGCNTPLILREFGDGWKLVGECYTHGVMYGEISTEEHELVDITIH
ncbi:heterokaryon incompatibility protein (het-6OR allele) [Fusarium heterosporum]|uniref:Heterokaryon incompatibility protein (Het-6OR allele) n=1 Tax=Fusarium heterosporum TaxID=42747 RepID=A0A8H5TRX0_FUSHE|nr:heterokaryon incompatibility protein (het-6OR allele) [Fusarium heterosporum]